jgi:hypothetical protein
MSEHSRTMRVPEKISFTHAEGVRWLADLPRRDGVTVTSGVALAANPKVVKRPSAWDRA